MKVLLVDNNDSFTYNIVEMLRAFTDVKLLVVSYDKLHIKTIGIFDKIIISPGPDKPRFYPKLNSVIEYCINSNTPLLGICLGHQSICEYFGAKLVQLETVIHGQQRTIHIDNHSTLYKELPKKIKVGLYHSWTIEHQTLPNTLKITAQEEYLMSIEHQNHNIFGMQFHPESFLTHHGKTIMKNFLRIS